MMLLGLFVLCLAWLMPGHYVPWVSFQQEFMSAAGAALLGFAAVRASRATRWPFLAWAVIACALIPLLQLATGQVRFIADGVLAALYLAGFGLCVAAGATLAHARREDWLDGLTAVLVTGAILSTGLALVQWLRLPMLGVFLWDLAPGAKPWGNLAQSNHLATLIAFGVAGTLRWYEARRIGGAVAALAIAWLGFGLAMTQSRTGWLFVVLVLAGWLALRRRAALRLPGGAVLAGAAAYIALVAAWGPLNEALYLPSTSLAERLQPGSRLTAWIALADASWRSPWIGYGWTQVGLAQQVAALDHEPVREYFRNSHNLLLDLVIWNGLPIGLLIAGGVAVWFIHRVRRCHEAERWTLLLAVVAAFLHALLEYPLEYAYFLLPVGLLMGTLEALEDHAGVRSLPRVALAIPAVVLSAALVWVGVEYIRVEEAARTLRFVTLGIGVDRVREAPLPEVRLLDAPREFHRFVLTQARAGMTPEELEWMRRIAERYPYPPALLRLALAQGLNGDPQAASANLERICRMHPLPRCAEGRRSWILLQGRYPELRRVNMSANVVAITPESRP